MYVTAVGFALGLVTGALYAQRILTPEMVDLLKTCIYATGGTLAVGKFAEGAKE